MAEGPVVTRKIDAAPDRVWSVLADGWLYPSWVVGASRMRAVDEHWPAEGALLHHSVGTWPALLDDVTRSLEARPNELLRLRAHGWPAGAAEVDLRLRPVDAGTEVSIQEDAVDGPAVLVPSFLRSVFTVVRNREALLRLAFLAENRGRAGGSAAQDP